MQVKRVKTVQDLKSKTKTTKRCRNINLYLKYSKTEGSPKKSKIKICTKNSKLTI